MRTLRGRHLLELVDYESSEVEEIIRRGLELKERQRRGERIIPLLEGRVIALLFEKPSTRTRVSLEVAAHQLGARALYMRWDELQLARGESVADTARTLSRYVDGIVARVRKHETLVELARYSSVPVINGLSDVSHPLQALADMMTILEKKGRLRGVKLVFVGDGSDNVLNSLIVAGAKLGLHIVISSPPQLRPHPELLAASLREAEKTGATIEFIEDPREAVRGADVVYTDVWVSMGQEDVAELKKRLLKPYQVNGELMSLAGDKAIFMHCLPARRGEEVTDEVIDGPQSVVWDQAENRLHAQKAVLSLLIP
ncbi:MAG: ornithine carbamoyltransferase [Acidilobaceae archaeon]